LGNEHLFEEIQAVSLSMFRKNFFGIYHGSISARVDAGSFIINKKEAIFDEIELESLIKIDIEVKDYKYNIASIDTPIHEQIYQDVPSAKYIAYTMPPYATAYSLKHDTLSPVDYFGDLNIGSIDIYDPGNFGDWYNRAPYEISNFFSNNSCKVMLIRGYGLIAYDRDISQLAKKIALLENSARLLLLSS